MGMPNPLPCSILPHAHPTPRDVMNNLPHWSPPHAPHVVSNAQPILNVHTQYSVFGGQTASPLDSCLSQTITHIPTPTPPQHPPPTYFYPSAISSTTQLRMPFPEQNPSSAQSPDSHFS